MVANFSASVPPIDTNQVKAQLAAFGYKKGDTVYLRSFYPSDDPRRVGDKGRKAESRSLEELIKSAEQFQSEGRGVYLVVNGGGHADDKVKQCRAIFYEHDNLIKESQIDLWKVLRLPEPSLQIDTGGKSIHSYWIFDQHIEPDQWRQLQSDLLEYSDADRSLKNPSRVMRLAGCYHFAPNRIPNGQTRIILNSGKRYSYQEMRDFIPHCKAELQGDSPVIDDWGDMRILSQYLEGYKPGGRRGWITCKCPVHGGVSNDSLHVNESTGKYHCQKQCDTKEIFRVTLDIAKSKGHFVPEKKQQTAIANTKSNVIPHPTVAKQLLSGDEIIKEIDSLIDTNVSKSKLQGRILDLATRSGRTSNEIWRLYRTRDDEESETFDREIATRQLPTLLEAQKASLSPDNLLWGDGGKLAYLLRSTAESMPVSVEALLTTLFPVAGSRIGTSSRLIVNARTSYTVTSIFWSCVVSKTGTLKSPAQKVIINPLDKLEAQEYHNWRTASDDYKKELKRCGKGDELPDEPAPRKRFIVQGCTTEARMKIHGENPRGLLYYRDEWASFITGRNKYRGGKGDDAQLDLSEFNGDALYKDVIDGEKCIYLEHSAISRTGNTQPEVLKKFQSEGNFADCAGEFARWLYCCKESPLAFIDLFADDDGVGKLLNDDLTFLYQYLGRLPERDYFLSPEAKRIFQSYQHQLMKWLAVEEHPGLAATYPKLQTYLGRFALWLHLVNSVLSGESTPAQFIDGQTMQAAVQCIDFYLAQARLMYAQNSDQQAIAGNLLKIKEYIEKRPNGSTVRDIRSGVFSLRKVPAAEIERDCKTLLSSGVIKQVAKKYFPFLSKNDDGDDQLMIHHHHPKTIDVYGLEKNDDGDDQKIIASEKQTQLDGYLTRNSDDEFIVETDHQTSSLLESPAQQDLQSDDDGSSNIITIIDNTDKVKSDEDNQEGVSNSCLLKVGDLVAAADPFEEKSGWCGEVKEVSADGLEVVVLWPERQGKPVSLTERHEISYLRLVERRS